MVRLASAKKNPEVARRSWHNRPLRSLRFTCLALGAVLSISFAQGEKVNEVDQLSLGDLLNMKLTTGSFLELNLSKSPLSITVIEENQVKLSGARNLSEVLEIYVPGFVYGYNKWNGTVWGMRGVFNDRNSKVLCLVNGHKMNPQSRDGYQAETVLGALGDIKQIEVLRGPAGLVYGAGAISGIINIITKSAKENSNSEVSITMGDRKTVEPQVNIYLKPNEDHSITLSGGYKKREGIPEAQTYIYGKDGWPVPEFLPNSTIPIPYNQIPHDGIPSDGNYGNTAGNWRLSGEWDYKDLVKLYARSTHQEENAGAWFPYDPWPEYMPWEIPKGSTRHLGAGREGPAVTSDDPFWTNTESYECSQRQYVIDNLMADLQLKIPVSGNEIKINGGFDGYASKIESERRDSYMYTNAEERTLERVESDFGEFRYTLSGLYLLKTITNLQAAGGLEYRRDNFGTGLFGTHSNAGQKGRYVVSETSYNTLAAVVEGMYDFTDKLALHLGGRVDLHTRATLANGKIALVYSPSENHSLKFIAQTSSNNGGADEYEYNRHHFLEGNIVLKGRTVFDNIYQRPTLQTPILTVPTEEKMHSLKPERVYSYEADYVGKFADVVTLTPSFAYTTIKDLFTWDQNAFSQINCKGYSFINGDLEGKFRIGPIEIGASHSYTRVVNTEVDKADTIEYLGLKDGTKDSDPWIDSLRNSTGSMEYYPNSNYLVKKKSASYLVKNTVSADGETFKNIPSNMTKVYVTYSPWNFVSFHTNARIWWGLDGRSGDPNATDPNEQMLAYQQKTLGYEVFQADKEPIVKLNASVLFHLPNDFSVGIFGTDILGIDRGPYYYKKQNERLQRNTLRYQQAGQYAMSAEDQFSMGVKVAKEF